MPIAFAYASNFGFSFRLITASMTIKKSRPPSSPGIGRTLKNAREIERSPARFSN